MAYRNHLAKKYLAVGVAGRSVFEFRSSSEAEVKKWASSFMDVDQFHSVVAYDTISKKTVLLRTARLRIEKPFVEKFPQGRLF